MLRYGRDMAIRALLVDAGGTLVLPDHGVVEEVLASIGLGVDRERLDDAHYIGMAAFDRLAVNDAAAALVYRRAYAVAAGVPDDRLDEAITAFGRLSATQGHWIRPIPGAREMLEVAGAAGLPIVIVSNTERGDAAEQLATAGVCQVGPGPGARVDHVVDSALLGRAKPDPLMFETACRAVGIPAAAAVHVGDSLLADIRGAEASGIAAIHVDPLGRCPDRDHPHVATVRELPSLLGLGPAVPPPGRVG
jgi:putative hydrolase of the HAD superfamily